MTGPRLGIYKIEEKKIKDLTKQIVKLKENHNLPLRAIAERYGVTPATVCKWIKRYGR